MLCHISHIDLQLASPLVVQSLHTRLHLVAVVVDLVDLLVELVHLLLVLLLLDHGIGVIKAAQLLSLELNGIALAI